MFPTVLNNEQGFFSRDTPYGINRLIFAAQRSVPCEVQTEFFYVLCTEIRFSKGY
jgi:hypothetical protein